MDSLRTIEWEIKKCVISFLGQTEDPSVLKPLTDELNGNALVINSISKAMRGFGVANCDILIAELPMEEKWRNEAIASTLGQLRCQNAIAPLIETLGSKDRWILSNAAVSLRVITGESFGEDQARWSEWWNEEKR